MRSTMTVPALCALLASIVFPALSMNARYVTVDSPAERMRLITIRNDAVTASETIGSWDVANPVFSFDGTRVACWRNNGSGWHLSVMDYTAKTFTDLVDLSQWAADADVGAGHNTGGAPIRWPAGDWIYAKRPGLTGEIWRINVNDPSQREMLVDYTNAQAGTEEQKIYAFYLAADLHVAMTAINDIVWYSGHGGQYVHYFPPTDDDPSLVHNFLFNLPNCNPCLSPTGTFCGRFTDGGHTKITMYRLNSSDESYDYMTGLPRENGSAIFGVDLEAWSGQSDWTECFENPDFAVNSDRWMIMRVGLPGTGLGLTGGTNSVAFSWQDQKAINITTNQMGTTSLTGSMFIEDGPSGSIQGIDGAWSAMAPVEVFPRISVAGNNPYDLTLTSVPPGADLYYTTDGTDPTQSSTQYTETFSVPVPADRFLWVKARAYMNGKTPSNVTRMRLGPVALIGEGLTCQLWKDVPGETVADLEADPRYPDSPSDTWVALGARAQYGEWWTQTSIWDPVVTWGYRLCGYVIPPLSGTYTFSAVGVSDISLRLSPSDDPAAAVEIAAGSWEWYVPAVSTPPAQSSQMQLTAGAAYYIEVLFKHGNNNNSPVMSVGWTLPNGETEDPIPAARLMPLTYDPTQGVTQRPVPGAQTGVTARGSGAAVVYDALGTRIATLKGMAELSTTRLPAGIYFVGALNGKHRSVRRVVVRRDGVIADAVK